VKFILRRKEGDPLGQTVAFACSVYCLILSATLTEASTCHAFCADSRTNWVLYD